MDVCVANLDTKGAFFWNISFYPFSMKCLEKMESTENKGNPFYWHLSVKNPHNVKRYCSQN